MNYLERFFNEKINRQGETLSENTRINYESDINQFLTYVGKDELNITASDVSEWYGAKRNEYELTSLSRKVNALKSYFRFLLNIKIIESNPMDILPNFKPKAKDKRVLSKEELNAIIRQSKSSRDEAIIHTLASTGIRISELINLRLSDLDEESIVITGKGNKDREIFLSEKAKLSIKEYLTTRKDTDIDNLFINNNGKPMSEQTVRGTIKTLSKRAMIDNYDEISPHTFRRTFATLLANNGVPVPTIQKSLGHEDISTTMLYIKVDNTQVKKAMCMGLY